MAITASKKRPSKIRCVFLRQRRALQGSERRPGVDLFFSANFVDYIIRHEPKYSKIDDDSYADNVT